MANFHDRYSPFFHSGVHDLSEVSRHYLHGLFQSSKKNMERIEEVVCGSVYENLQNFISDSPWQEMALLTQLGKDANNLLGGQEDSCLLLDESGFPKKGTKSVGVKRQWCGEVGKVENCQVGVFMSLCRGNHAVPINYRLFLPQEWTDDQTRCDEAKIPLKHQEYKSKHQLALEMVVEARENNLSYNWIGADGFYGESPWLLRQLDELGEIFLIDVHKSQQDGKNECGMGDYQVRSWIGWHHHMAMVLLAMLFMTEERLLHKESIKLLSCTDIVQLLKTILPRRDITVAEVLRQIKAENIFRFDLVCCEG